MVVVWNHSIETDMQGIFGIMDIMISRVSRRGGGQIRGKKGFKRLLREAMLNESSEMSYYNH